MSDEKEKFDARIASDATHSEPLVKRLTADELSKLHRDMLEASQWARAELQRRKGRISPSKV